MWDIIAICSTDTHVRMKKKNTSYLNSICLLSVLLAAGSAAPALATEYEISTKEELQELLIGSDLKAGDTIKITTEFSLNWNTDIGLSVENFSYNGSVTLAEGSILNIGRAAAVKGLL